MKKPYFVMAAGLVGACLTGCQPQSQPTEITRIVNDSTGQLNVAYINVDSLLLNYDFAKDLNEAIVKKMEDARASINSEGQKFEREAAEFQKKLQTNAFLSEDRARSEADRLQRRQAELEQLQARLQNDIAQQQAEMNQRLNDTVRNYLREYNAVKQYEMIFSNTMYDNILIDFPKYDITAEVLQGLNERYASFSKK